MDSSTELGKVNFERDGAVVTSQHESSSPSSGKLKKQFLQRKSNPTFSNGTDSHPHIKSPGLSDAHLGLSNLTVNNHQRFFTNGDDSGFGENVYGEIGSSSSLQSVPSLNGQMSSNMEPESSTFVANISSMSTERMADSPSDGPSIIKKFGSTVNEATSTAHIETYQLRPKRRRHVYHEITLPFQQGQSTGDCHTPRTLIDGNSIAPPLPFKPHYLRSGFRGDMPPPVPPRSVNKDAIFQRKQLTEEYFENIRKSLDADELIEEDVLPPSAVVAQTTKARFQNDPGAGPSNLSAAPPLKPRDYRTAENDTLNGNQRQSAPAMSPPQNFLGSQEAKEAKRRKEKTFPGLHTGTRVQLIQSLKCLKQCGWYWGNMTWEDAEAMLGYKPNVEGVFLVRDSQDPLHLLTLTVRSVENSIHHVRIEHSDGKFQLYEPSGSVSRGAANCVRHPNIVTFVKLVMKHSRSGTFIYFVKPRNMGEPPVQIRLLTPISRFSCVKSLKYYSRFVIKEVVPNESIHLLPIPVELKEYLRTSQYFDKDEDFKCALAS